MKAKRLMKRLLGASIAAVMGLSAMPLSAKAAELPHGRLNWWETYQTIDGFGVSQAADVYARDIYEFALRDEVMDLLFSRDKGIGLSILRCEVGNGLNMPTIEPQKGVWDFTPYEPEQWVIREARARGVDKIMSTVWSPPVWMKTNNKITNGGRLKKECYQDYADYLAAYIKGYRDYHGVTIDAVSIANEPEYAATWQSCLWSGAEFTDFLANYLGPTFEREGLTTDVIVGEEGTWTEKRLYDVFDDWRATQAFDIVGAHYYHGGPHIFGSAQNAGKRVWLTETSATMSWSTDFKDGVCWSRYIHNFMTGANTNAFIYWLGASWKRNNESLIRFDGEHSYIDAKRLYSMGNYSKFVRPGFVRIGITENPVGNVHLSAYKNPNTGEFAIVAVNDGWNNESFVLDFDSLYCGELTPHITNDRYNLETMDPIATDGRSVQLNISGLSTITWTGVENSAIPQGQDWRLTDYLDDYSKIYDMSRNWMLEGNNPYNAFEHDTSRARRTKKSREYIVYQLDDMTYFEALIYYHIALQGMSFEVSSDGWNWQEISVSYPPATLTGGYWEKILVTPTWDLPYGTRYLKVVFDKGGKAWDKHLSEINIR